MAVLCVQLPVNLTVLLLLSVRLLIKKYEATQGHDVYQAHRKNCGRKSNFLKKTQFIRYVHIHFIEDGWSLDVCSNRATATGEFASSDVAVCLHQNLYNYDLPEKLKHNTKLHRVRKNKKKLGRSIEERPKEINGLIRRFIPKGEAIANYSLQDIIDIETWCNSLPRTRKILAYHTPDEIFERELDLIYQAA